MDLKNKKSPRKSLNKSHSSNSCTRKKSPQSRQRSKKKQPINKGIFQYQNNQKKKETSTLTRKKIDELKTPELIIKINYKGKRISIPIYQLDNKNLKETVIKQIIRFQKEILKNYQFKDNIIENWKITGSGDILKDYYFQTGKTLAVFKGQVLDIQPIWKQNIIDPISLKDFQIIKCIGTGGFSRVFLVRMKPNGKFYALKLMEKQGLIGSGKQCVVTNQRDIMVDLDCPQILKLQFAFETKHFVALGLQYCPGGQLFYYLRKVRRMTQDQARYCFIEILLGIQYLHNKRIIYRDIKPQNIMIDMDGNLKIADFGLSKIGLKPNQLAETYCGSPQYMAPEMLSKSGHSYSVDYYCLGALLYELVTGNPPFYSRNVQKIYYSIQNQEIDFPPHVELSSQIKMLLEGLLIKDPKRRLGTLGGIRQILGHPWVRKIKPLDILQKKIQTPIKINLLTFNINQEQVDQMDHDFLPKFQDQDNNFQPVFQDFYYHRNQNINILDDALPSVKSDSTKQNKSLNSKLNSQKIAFKSQSKDRKHQNSNLHLKSDSRNQLGKTNIKPNKSKKTKKVQPNLIQRGRKRDFKQKSINRGEMRLNSPKGFKKNTLKRIKSSTALIEQRYR